MSARRVSLILSIVGLLMIIGGTIYYIINFVETKNKIVGIDDVEEVEILVKPFISGMLIWVMGNFILATFINAAATMAYALKSNSFQADAMFFIKIGLVFLPIVLCGIYFLITNTLKP